MKLATTPSIALFVVLFAAPGVLADELTMMVEESLAALGYATGAVDGEESMETVIAISKFQAENQMEVTGEVTPQLAGILSAKVDNPDSVRESAGAAAEVPESAQDPDALQAAQQACLQKEMEKAQELLTEAGFTDISIHQLEHDFQNDYYVIRKQENTFEDERSSS